MTVGEMIIYRTIKDNFDSFPTDGFLRIELSSIENKKQFKEALSSLKKSRFITYDISFMSVIIRLTPKGSFAITNDRDFSTSRHL